MFNNTDLMLAPGSFTTVEVDQTTQTSDLITGLNNVTYGGTLVITNLTGTLTTSDSFNAYIPSNSNALTSADIAALDAIGYTIVPAQRIV